MFHWWRAYHVRLWKLDCLPRISARALFAMLIHRWITKKSRAPSRKHATFGQPKLANVLWMTLCTELNLTFFRKLIKYFMYFRMNALFFRFFDSWYIIKYLHCSLNIWRIVSCPMQWTLRELERQLNTTVPIIRWSQVSFSEFWVELLNAKDWAVYQIEANKKLYLV